MLADTLAEVLCWQAWSLPCTDCQCTPCIEGQRHDAPPQRHFGTYRMLPFLLELRLLLPEPARLHLAYTAMSPVPPPSSAPCAPP